MFRRWRETVLMLMGAVWCGLAPAAWAGPPAQKLPSAYLVFPLIDLTGGRDTRIELVNLSGTSQTLECFYIDGDSCNETGFLISFTPYQPLSWLASDGLSNTQNGSAVPPFPGAQGELKCVVVPALPDLSFHNTMQGRAIVYDTNGETVSYGAVAFQRLSDGDFTGTVALNGSSYAQCPDKLHFEVLSDQPTSSSDLVLVPCAENLLLQIPTTVGVQYIIFNEFETQYSASKSFSCFDRRALADITAQLNRATLGSDTAHIVARGTNGPILGLVVDRVPGARTAGNEPSFQGGRSANVIFPPVADVP